MLKTAVQSQLEGVRTGILLLAAARDDVNDIQKKLDEADTIYQDLSKLAVQLQVSAFPLMSCCVSTSLSIKNLLVMICTFISSYSSALHRYVLQTH